MAAGLTTMGTAAQAAPPQGDTAKSVAAPVDDLPSPAEEKQRAMRQEALSDVLSGDKKAERRGDSTVVRMGTKPGPKSKSKNKRGKVDQYVELSRDKTDKIFVVLAEFGNERHPSYPDQDTDPNTAGPTRFDGPLHNQIPAPDRTKDDKTIWEADYSRAHYQKLYFGTGASDSSVKKWYETQSSGRYSVDGQVTDWVKVPYNEARYGRSNGFPCAGAICTNSWALIKDALGAWVAD